MEENNNQDTRQLFKGIIIGFVVAMFFGAAGFWALAATGSKMSNDVGIDRKIDEIVKILDNNYVEDVDMEKLQDGLYQGLVAGVGDRYTTYMSSKDYKTFIETMSGSYAGIGVYIYANDEDKMITVSAPIKGSPGELSGLLPNDKIIKVNGVEVSSEEIDEAIAMMKGVAGTDVVVTIFRKDTAETFDVKVTRAHIDVPTVEGELLDGDVGYIRISSFDENTYDQFIKLYEDLDMPNRQGLIIDVRNNLGGYLDQVVKICDVLLPECTIVYREDHDGKKQYDNSSARESFDKPMAVLINGASASASEILAGALKGNDKADLVGTTTFGKGLVQKVFTLDDRSAVKVTVEKYFTPDGICINGIGIAPDYEIEMPKELESSIEISHEDDPQIQKALEVVMDKEIPLDNNKNEEEKAAFNSNFSRP